jgi:Flp pilus assembly protein TadD
MTTPKAAPEIFQIPFAELDPAIVPADVAPGSPEFEQALIMHYALKYAGKGWQALVTMDRDYVRVLAIPERGMDPKDYVLGLLQNGFLEDALPILQALDGMLDDPEIAYNLGICLSELGQVAECIAPLQRCTRLDPGHSNGWVGLGVAHSRLGQADEAESALEKAVKLAPDNPYAQRNLGAVLMKAGRNEDALPHLRRAVELAPEDPAALLGLAQCLEALGGDARKEADRDYVDLIERFPKHPIAEMARAARTRLAQAKMREAGGGTVRMDAVFYLQDALERFGGMSPAEVGQATLEIALLGRQGLEINDPDRRYALKSLAGDFSGLHLLCLMHVGIRQLDPKADTGTGLDKEYDLALAMTGKGA